MSIIRSLTRALVFLFHSSSAQDGFSGGSLFDVSGPDRVSEREPVEGMEDSGVLVARPPPDPLTAEGGEGWELLTEDADEWARLADA